MKKHLKFFLLILVLFTILNLSKIKSVDAMARPDETIDEYPPCYQQAEGLYAPYTVGGASIASNGCGLLALINGINYLTGNLINPYELTDYAYKIDAYNGSIGGGTARYVLYPKLDSFAKKYGFKVTFSGNENGVLSQTLFNHLENKGIALALVKGHFIMLADYDRSQNKILVYDSAANIKKRFTYPKATWLTVEQLATSDYMTIFWWALFEKDCDKVSSISLDDKVVKNGKSYVSIDTKKSKIKEIDFSGYLLDTRGIESYYYTIDYKNRMYPLTTVAREDVLKNYPDFAKTNKASKCGFSGTIKLNNLSCGEHIILVSGKTIDGGVSDIAEIRVFVSDGLDGIDKNARTNTINMSRYYGQRDIQNTWSAAGLNSGYYFVANYGTVVKLGKIDFAKYKKAEIYYSTDNSFDADKSGKQSVIGLKKVNESYGYFGTDINLGGDIAHANMTDGSGGWTTFRKATLDLSNFNEKTEAYLNGYNQQNALYCVSKIVLYYNDDEIIEEDHYLTTIVEKINDNKVLTKENIELNNNQPINIGLYDLSNYDRMEIILEEKTNAIFSLKKNNTTLNDVSTYDVTGLISAGYSSSKIVIVDLSYHDYQGEVYFGMINDEKVKIKSISFFPKSYKVNVPAPVNNGHYEYIGYYNNDYNFELIPHTYEDQIVDSTCKNEGYILHSCKCGYSYKDLIELKEHKFGEWLTVIYSTCKEEGKEVSACEACGKRSTRAVPKLEHLVVYTVKEYPTCSKVGKESGECINCHEMIERDIPCNDVHVNTSILENVDESCTEEGLTEGLICSDCNKILTPQEKIPPTGHELVNGKCIICGFGKETKNKNCHKMKVFEILSTITLMTTFIYLIRKH